MSAYPGNDERQAAIEAIRDYLAAKSCAFNASDRASLAYSHMFNPGSGGLSRLPKGYNSARTHKSYLDAFAKIEGIREERDAARAFIAWFEAAWQRLDDTDRMVLETYYMQAQIRIGAALALANKLGCSERQVDRLRKKALQCLASKLFDKERQKYFFACAGSNRSVKEKMSE